MSGPLRPVLLVLLAVVAAAGFHDLSRRYAGFRLWEGPPAGWELHPLELTFLFWYVLFGLVVAGSVAVALVDRPLDVGALEERIARWARSPWLAPGAALFAFTAALAAKDLALAQAPVSDDENVYVFIARTLALGRVSNPLPDVPPEDLHHFGHPFVVLGPGGWYGKYPIGHPLLLALGELAGARVLVGPLLAAVTVVATFGVGRRLLGEVGGGVATLLVATSPQLVLTAATEHSQNTSTAAMTLGLLFALRGRDRRGAERRRALLASGLCFGLSVLARPMPGGPLVAAAAIWILFWWNDEPLRDRVVALIPAAIGVSLFLGALGLSNALTTGHPLKSGYQVVHGALPSWPQTKQAALVASVAGALARQLVWAFGWPFSFAFLPFAARPPRQGGPSLAPLWLLVAAVYSYRLLAPKVFVGATGPLYVAEAVPLCAVLTAAGMLRLRRVLRELVPRWSPAVAGFALGSALSATALFLPFSLSWLRELSRPQRFVADTLVERGISRAVVFATNVTDEAGAGWALHPPLPSPTLDDPIVYLRRRKDPAANVAFWQRHFADRAAFSLEIRGGEQALVPIAPGSERPLRAPGR